MIDLKTIGYFLYMEGEEQQTTEENDSIYSRSTEINNTYLEEEPDDNSKDDQSRFYPETYPARPPGISLSRPPADSFFYSIKQDKTIESIIYIFQVQMRKVLSIKTILYSIRLFI